MSERYWDSRMETLPPERRAQFREHRLHWQLRRCWDGSPFYRARLEARGIDPTAYGGREDWERVPLLHPSELPAPENPEGDEPSEAWTVAPRQWWESRESVGEAPRLVRVLTDGDVVHRADRAARALWAAGARPGQPVVVGQAAFSAGSATADALGAGAARIGSALRPGAPEQADAIWSPSWPVTEESASSGIGALSLPYVGSTVAHTCEAGEGIHWADDHFLIEVIDPGTGRAAPAGAKGALVVTDLTREGSPVLRFWTGYQTAIFAHEPCACGRTSMRSSFVRRGLELLAR